ncbi:twin-arginine translocase TatA/TatE family subunit [Rahnella sp. C60]|uniref:twin-arginine translocase TatA/TatE family subunit n=1 Tax=Rahnella TaxID=34037 RepID=UPI00101F133D|nr:MULTISPECIES: twin-arginine translocase TatA/TatE family subunit [Rahnella]UJD91312.1 twin-arginine translocase TatA/TatE family subunit [Rahnella aquatilis]MBU9812688.1 twin-arginine translocase TatA/TatE family subunit [Rahnella perminowiae]MBU9814163.1 twin-arginine translocase TatA/TatE family subunit [Rahnella perminowiae]MBU9825323.1 twin-arginine translocase TatA/TatE family subunit [Rahnella perminowiae]MCR8999535.1 twin-arginine translocase TatA/TatE family subunit [Rahnella permin
MGGISITKILILVVLVVLLFGTKKLRGLGADLGASIKGFKKAMSDDDTQPKPKDADIPPNDADFVAKSVESKPETKAEDTKSQNKEQV